MKRWAAGVLLLGSALAACAAELHAGEWFERLQRTRHEYPPRYQRGSMSHWYKTRDRDGNVTYRQVYPGYGAHFPPPAYLYYGYPHSGDFTGMGIDGTP
jgi:hypothetical protein